jgi:excinuclease ABC subunit A
MVDSQWIVPFDPHPTALYMPSTDIVIKGAREHNLRDVGLTLPRNKLICLTGVSGSGKSSLAFDTLYAEGQRRYVESLSSFARQFLGQMPKPDVDYISGLSPSISISQKSSGQNPRSTVGTITEIYDFLRVLYARVGQGNCPQCRQPITAQTRDHIIERIAALPVGTKFAVLAPLIRGQKGEWRDLFVDLLKQGFVRARVDGNTVSLNDNLKLDRQMRHNIEVVIDRLTAGGDRARMAEAVELALKVGKGELIVAPETGETDEGEPDAEKEDVDTDETTEATEDEAATGKRGSRKKKRGAGKYTSGNQPGDIRLSSHYACMTCGISFEPPSPQLFSFNSPQGMCHTCHGLGEVYTFAEDLLIPNPKLSFKQGCIEIIGPWKDLGRWKRHIYQGVADTMERKLELEAGTLLDTPWCDLDPEYRNIWLQGTGSEHITYTWRGGNSPQKYGGEFAGILPEQMESYRDSSNDMHRKHLEKYMRIGGCESCAGSRLNPQARHVTVTTSSSTWQAGHTVEWNDPRMRSLPEVCQMSVSEASQYFEGLRLGATGEKIAGEVLKEIRGRLGFLINVGLEYLSLNRTAPTLSGGESQRIRLAGQVGCGLVGVLYILDEPSIGLHPRDNDRLLDTLTTLRDLGNTVVVVEHDEDTMRAADTIIDFGPGAGVRGGEVVAVGKWNEIAKVDRSLTGKFLSGKDAIAIPEKTRPLTDRWLRIVGARHNNLKNVDFEVPLGAFVCVTGVSGGGKSSLVNDILVEALRRDLNNGLGEPGLHDSIEGLEQLDKLIAIDQSPIGRTPRSNPATYIKLADDIRDLFAQLSESKAKGYKPGRFSFNVAGGRCEACEGNGSNKLDMDFLADVWVTCPVCEGHRFNRETLQVKFKDKNIAEVLEMDVQQALDHFVNIPKIHHKLQTLHDVGLDYLKLGQPSPTLSGGEAQRIKLARELVKRSTGKTLYLLDEPTTGLHFADIKLLLQVLQNFVDAGNTVLVVEHNLDVIKTADWIIDLGPEGGAAGGEIIATGTPREIADRPNSYTGRALKPLFDTGHIATSTRKTSAVRAPTLDRIRLQGARQHNLKSVDVEIMRDQLTVCCGMSGSGKSSLAFDTVYAEGQRRYVESLSSYARQFVGQMQKPALDHIEGLSPAIAIEQKHMGHTPRSTVGTVTEIYDYLRILMARLGEPYCPDCDIPIGTQTADEIIDKILQEPTGTKVYLLAPRAINVGDKYEALWEEVRSSGFARVRIDGQTYNLDEVPTIDRRRKHSVEVVVDRVTIKPDGRSRLADSIEQALSLGKGTVHLAYVDEKVPEPKWRTAIHSQHFACDKCGRSFERLTPHNFSFNSALGWCTACEGLGTQTGANIASLLRDPKLSLRQGAVAMWQNVPGGLLEKMLTALAARTGLPLDVPFDQLSPRQRRVVLYGTADEWFDITADDSGKGKATGPTFRFQFKGLYPALDEAVRLLPGLRDRWEHLVGEVECSTCGGSRLRDDASAVRLHGKMIDQIGRTPLGTLLAEFDAWKLSARERKIAGELVREMRNRLQFLVDVGLEYLSLGRPAPTLSGGESQRIRLASQVGSGLCGVLYVLDEPTIGLHPRDNRRLLGALQKLRDLGNTLLVVEHDREVIDGADQLLDFGPAAGEAGGRIVSQGTPAEVARDKDSVTGPYLSGKKAIPVPTNRRVELRQPAAEDSPTESSNGKTKSKAKAKRNGKASEVMPTVASRVKKPATRKKAATTNSTAVATPSTNGELSPADVVSLLAPHQRVLEIVGARHNNLQNVTVKLPLGSFTAVTGVSGSGKSSLVQDVLYNALARMLHRARTNPGPHDALRGVEFINKVIQVDQSALGNSPSSNPATYTGVFDLIRTLFAQLPDARLRGYTPRRFSFNVPGGRCEDCEGNGQKKIEMHFLPDIWVECETCRGKRYNPETLAVQFHGHSVADVLSMSCSRALKLFENIPKIRRVLQTLCDVGLDYVTLGQPAPTLSGGEAQRVKLAAELARPDTGRTLYLLDEPTTGLHFDDIAKLLDVLNRLVDLGNTVVVIEHNLDVIKTADWIIDMGPEAGDTGGLVVACGTPAHVAAQASAYQRTKEFVPGSKVQMRSYTGEMLAPVLEAGPHVERKPHDFNAAEEERDDDVELSEIGRDAPMPWEANGVKWHTEDRIGRRGEHCRWSGRILKEVVDKIQATGEFGDANWNHRSVVEITGKTKSDGWFFHGLTGDEWLLTLKFRVHKNTFSRDTLVTSLGLKPLNEMHDLPVYGNEPRVTCQNLRGPFQEVQIRVHTFEEINTPAFWQFIERAMAGYQRFAQRVKENPEDVMPWKKLGQKWHFSRKGFPPGKPPQWNIEVLEELCELLAEVAPDGQFLWNNQQVVHLFVPGRNEAWATVYTKRLAGIDLILEAPSGQFSQGHFANFTSEVELSANKRGDAIKLKIVTSDDVHQSELNDFLQQYRQSTATATT